MRCVFHHHIKQLRSDQGDEYLYGEFKFYLDKEGIISQLSSLAMPQQNGVSERRNKYGDVDAQLLIIT